MQKTVFPSGFSAQATCGNELLALGRPSLEEFRRLPLAQQVRSVHGIASQLWNLTLAQPEYTVRFAGSTNATLFAARLGVISKVADLALYRDELLAISWYLSALATFTDRLNPETVGDLIAFQIKVATLLDGGGDRKLSVARANLRLNTFANLTLLYRAQLVGRRPMLAAANLHLILRHALDEGQRHHGSADTMVRPGLAVVKTMLDVLPRMAKTDRTAYVNLVEGYFKVIGTLAGAVLEDESELAHHQKAMFRNQLGELAKHPQLREVPAVKRSIARFIQLFEPPTSGQRPN